MRRWNHSHCWCSSGSRVTARFHYCLPLHNVLSEHAILPSPVFPPLRKNRGAWRPFMGTWHATVLVGNRFFFQSIQVRLTTCISSDKKVVCDTLRRHGTTRYSCHGEYPVLLRPTSPRLYRKIRHWRAFWPG